MISYGLNFEDGLISSCEHLSVRHQNNIHVRDGRLSVDIETFLFLLAFRQKAFQTALHVRHPKGL